MEALALGISSRASLLKHNPELHRVKMGEMNRKNESKLGKPGSVMILQATNPS